MPDYQTPVYPPVAVLSLRQKRTECAQKGVDKRPSHGVYWQLSNNHINQRKGRSESLKDRNYYIMTEMQKQYQGKFYKSKEDILHNARVEVYSRVGVNKVTYSKKAVFREPGWEDNRTNGRTSSRTDFEKGKAGDDSRMDSIRRAKKRVFQYAMLNDFEYFITWTLNKELIDRYDKKAVAEKMRNFLRNKVQRKNLRYIIVPELHKDGAIHAHGFVSGDLNMVNSGKRDASGRTIYNMTDWKYGWSTAVRISGDYGKACYYITKYVEKSDKMIFGNFYYAGGHGLERFPEVMHFDVLFDEIEGKEYECKATENVFKYQEIKTEEDPDGGENSG